MGRKVGHNTGASYLVLHYVNNKNGDVSKGVVQTAKPMSGKDKSKIVLSIAGNGIECPFAGIDWAACTDRLHKAADKLKPPNNTTILSTWPVPYA
jgi:hypothetical protein